MARNANRMQEAVDVLMARFGTSASVTITYGRGEFSIEDVAATVGRTPFQISDGEMVVAYESRDYLILKAALVGGNGTQLTPQAGDLITDNGRQYEVSIPKPLNVFESIGPDGTVFKIHTKAVT